MEIWRDGGLRMSMRVDGKIDWMAAARPEPAASDVALRVEMHRRLGALAEGRGDLDLAYQHYAAALRLDASLYGGSMIPEHWQDKHGRPKDLGEVWRLRKRAHEARCVLRGHPLGTEALVLVGDDVIATQVFRDPKKLVDETTAWRAAYEAKGWRGHSA